MPHMLESHIKDAEAADKAEEELLHATCDVKRQIWTRSKGNKSGTMLHFLFYGRTQKSNPLRVLLNIPWRSSSLGDSIFYHKGSRRTSAWERILAELGTFQGPGLRGPFGLCRVPGMLLIEATMSSLLLTSFE